MSLPISRSVLDSTHLNLGYIRDEYITDSDSNSSYTDGFSSSVAEDYEPEWSDKIGSRGDLFYIEPVSIDFQHNEDKNSTVNSSSSKPEEPKLPKGSSKLKRLVTKQIKSKQLQESQCSLIRPPEAISTLNSFNGETQEVLIEVNQKQHNYGRRATLCEVLFGIIPGRLNNSLGSYCDDKIIVGGLTPDGEAIRNGSIEIGYWLKTVDGIAINMQNMNEVLSAIKNLKKVKLTFQKSTNNSSDLQSNAEKVKHHSSLVKQLTRDRFTIEEMKASYQSVPHAVMYLNIGNNEDIGEDNVRYVFPDCNNVLQSLKGLFIALTHMISDVASHPLKSSTLLVQDQTILVGYIVEGQEVLVLALPANETNSLIMYNIASNVAKLMKYQYKTLQGAFECKDNKEYLDHFFLLFFRYHLSTILNNKFSFKIFMSDNYTCIHWLVLLPDLKIQVDNILSQFESADFEDMEDGYQDRRPYSILGSCCFYKGYMLASHLFREDLQDMHMYLQNHHLLTLIRKEPVSLVVVWKQVFPARRYSCSQQSTNYPEVEGQYYLMIVALRHYLIGILLEAGGCASQPENCPGPDSFFIEKAKDALTHLESLGIVTYINKCLESDPVPPLISIQSFLNKIQFFSNIPLPGNFKNQAFNNQKKKALYRKSQSHSNLLFPSNKKMHDVTSILKKRATPDSEYQQLLSQMSIPDGESDGDTATASQGNGDIVQSFIYQQEKELSGQTSTSSDGESRSSSEDMMFKVHKSQSMYTSAYDLTSFRKCLDTTDEDTLILSSSNILSGCENTLFHYMHLDSNLGVFLAPVRPNQDSITEEIISNFYRCCLNIHQIFLTASKCKDVSKSKQQCKFGYDRTLASTKEHGVLFHYTPSPTPGNKVASTLTYWVVGRLFYTPDPKEVYVCFHDSVPQDMMELAFQLGFGLSL